MIKIKRKSYALIFVYRLVNKIFLTLISIYQHINISIVASRLKENGKNNIIDHNLWVNNANNISLKSNIFIGRGVYLNAHEQIEIGNYCAIGAGSKFITANHGFSDISIPINLQKYSVSPIILNDDCWLGYNVIILPGVVLGKGCIVAAGAVVTRSFDDYSILAGVPAKLIRKRQLVEHLYKN